ncbi:hypothetical protein LTR12_014706, partial [Friedmanniomyces endolithicus]
MGDTGDSGCREVVTEEIAVALSNGDGYAIGSHVADWDVDGTTTSPAECATGEEEVEHMVEAVWSDSIGGEDLS